VTILAHISDLHFGTESPDILDGLLEDLRRAAPTLVVVSGDLTQRARRKQFAAARAFFDRIPFPRLVVPGNHDIPLFDVVTRFFRPLARYRHFISEDVDPFFRSETLAVMGLNTARSNTWKNGRVSKEQTQALRDRMGSVPEGAMKVLVTHHPFLPLPGDPSPVLVGGAKAALEAAEACGIDLMLAGHLHRGYTGDVRSHHLEVGRPILVAQAGTATSRRVREEANSYYVIELEPGQIGFRLRVWDGVRFGDGRSTQYLKRATSWETIAAPT
jgi:3',5'-cyclic AMP phosphodiesterase CpdA